MFDGGPDWHYWVRVALRACSRVWGGRGFILIPHQDGQVGPEMLRAVRTYDPDYVVTLERTYGTMEAVRPGSIRIRFDETRELDGDERTKFVAERLDEPIEHPADEKARLAVVEACASYRRRPGAGRAAGGREWMEGVTSCTADGQFEHLTSASVFAESAYDLAVEGIPYPRESCLAGPADWGGTLGVAVAAACGVVDLPQVGVDPVLSSDDFKSVASWLVGNGLPSDLSRASFAKPVQQMVWHPGVALNHDPARLLTVFDFTTTGTVPIARDFDYPGQSLVCIGDSAVDFALAFAHRRMYGQGLWLPPDWLWNDGVLNTSTRVFTLLRSSVYWQARQGREIRITSSTLSAAELDELCDRFRDPTMYRDRDGQPEGLADRIKSESASWPKKAVLYFAIAGDFGRDFAAPVNADVNGDVEMVTPFPPPLVTDGMLADLATRLDRNGAARLRWQVDVEFDPSETPHGRGLDGSSLLASGSSPFGERVRSGRDGATFESERLGLLMAGMPPGARLTRPRLRMPGLANWANLMANQHSNMMTFSAAGRQVELVRELWGDRAALATDFSGPIAAVLRRFRPAKTRQQLELAETDGVAMRTGAGDELFEPYLTFDGIIAAAGDSLPIERLRHDIDGFLRRRILRRGLALGCARCSTLAFFAIDEVSQVNRCPRCLSPNDLDQARWRKPWNEPTWYYDLHAAARGLVSQNGDVPLMLSHYLRSAARNYADVAELELLDEAGKATAELDLLAHADGQVITAEAKRPADLGKNPSAAMVKRARMAEQLQADQILLATAAPAWPPGVVAALAKELSEHPWKRVVPRGRLVAGLGTPKVTDFAVDAQTGTTTPWPQ
ncbi:hypothetical protein ACVMYR_28370 [Micromonospora sp. PTRAS2]